MAHITETDYKKMAEAVSDDLIHNKVPLTDSVAKLAASMEMNQEQVHRLCEAANNTTFGKLFQSRDKTAEDRMVEFDVADADKVLKTSIKEASHVTQTSDAVALDEYRSLRDDSGDDHYVKVAFELRPESQPNIERDKRTLRKTLEHLKHEKYATEYLYSDSIEALNNQFKRLYNDLAFSTFEKAAAAIHQDAAVRPLRDLRASMRLPEVTYDFSILTKSAGYVDNSRVEYRLFADAASYATKLNELTLGISKLETLL